MLRANLFHVENRLVGLWVNGVVVYGTVIGLYAVGGEKGIDLCSCPNGGTIAVGCIVVDWAIGIESRVESQTCANASSLHLTSVGDVGSHIVPCKKGLSDVWLCLNPALVDGVCKAIGIDGSA